MNPPISETTFAANRLRKVGTRNGRHKLDAPCGAELFSAVSVNWLCPGLLLAIGPSQSGVSSLKMQLAALNIRAVRSLRLVSHFRSVSLPMQSAWQGNASDVTPLLTAAAGVLELSDIAVVIGRTCLDESRLQRP